MRRGSPQAGPPKFRTLEPLGLARWIKFLEWVDIKNKLNLTKVGSATMEKLEIAHQNLDFKAKMALRNLDFKAT